MLLNNEVVLDAAGRFARRILSESPSGLPKECVGRAYLIAFGRTAEPDELAEGIAFVARHQALVNTAAAGNAQPATKDKSGAMNTSACEALADFCHALLNANEFLYIE